MSPPAPHNKASVGSAFEAGGRYGTGPQQRVLGQGRNKSNLKPSGTQEPNLRRPLPGTGTDPEKAAPPGPQGSPVSTNWNKGSVGMRSCAHIVGHAPSETCPLTSTAGGHWGSPSALATPTCSPSLSWKLPGNCFTLLPRGPTFLSHRVPGTPGPLRPRGRGPAHGRSPAASLLLASQHRPGDHFCELLSPGQDRGPHLRYDHSDTSARPFKYTNHIITSKCLCFQRAHCRALRSHQPHLQRG